jgi:1-acyl-sn-glycerol-3-phosphate acyltransferase
MNWLYGIVRLLVNVVGFVYFRLEAHGTANVPLEGPLILACNHASNLDPPFVAGPPDREFHSLGKQELFRVPIFGAFLRGINVHPIRRDGMDRAALKECVEIVKSGSALLVFPEGTRTPDGQLQAGKAGAAMIAVQTGARIVPAYIDGTFAAMRRGVIFPRPRKVRVYYGAPFLPDVAVTEGSRRDRYDAIAGLMMERIAALRDEATSA